MDYAATATVKQQARNSEIRRCHILGSNELIEQPCSIYFFVFEHLYHFEITKATV